MKKETMPKQTQKRAKAGEEWEKEFNKRFPFYGDVFTDQSITIIQSDSSGSNTPQYTTDREMVKSFISQLLQKERQKYMRYGK